MRKLHFFQKVGETPTFSGKGGYSGKRLRVHMVWGFYRDLLPKTGYSDFGESRVGTGEPQRKLTGASGKSRETSRRLGELVGSSGIYFYWASKISKKHYQAGKSYFGAFSSFSMLSRSSPERSRASPSFPKDFWNLYEAPQSFPKLPWSSP